MSANFGILDPNDRRARSRRIVEWAHAQLTEHRWLERRRERILPAPYFHIVFTLPAELRPLVMAHREPVFTMLFHAASETLLTLARDSKRLGATPSITMVLHTWTRDFAANKPPPNGCSERHGRLVT